MASRRQGNRTEDSTYSIGSTTKEYAHLAAQYLVASDLENMQDNEVLQCSLSVKSVISTSSSFAKRSQQASSRPELQAIAQIGEGLQGAIFERMGHPLVLKKEKPGNDMKKSNLIHEYSMHSAVKQNFELYEDIVEDVICVPSLARIIQKEDPLVQSYVSSFPPSYRTHTTLVEMERILPLPKVARKAIITQFHPSPTQSTVNSILNEASNKHCLARTYLGKKKGSFGVENFSLRNFPLDLTSLMRLRIDVDFLATAMGTAYGVMHWGAGVNGDDVEFVLGTSAVSPEATAPPDIQHRQVGLYLLDFGQCEQIDLSEDDVEFVYQRFKGTMVTGDNQLFIPNCLDSPELYQTFKKAYIATGQAILTRKNLENKFNMKMFMEEYEEYAEDLLRLCH